MTDQLRPEGPEPERTVLVGKLTLCREVWPEEARTVMVGPRGSTWASDYPTPGTALVIRRFLALVDEGNWAPGFGMYTLERRRGLVCGGLAFYGIPDSDGRVEVGYGLAPSGRGQGLMVDALQAAVRWALGTGRVFVVWAGVDEGNLASIATLERSGFVRRDDNQLGRVYEHAR